MRFFFQRSPFILLFALLLAASMFLATPARAQGLPHPAPQARIVENIDESSLVTLRGNTHPLAQPRFDQGTAPVSMSANRLLLILSRSTLQEAELQSYLQSVQNPDSPTYHRFLSPDEFGKEFGVGDSDLQSIQSWLAGQGFTVNKVAKGRMAIEISGTVGQIQSAFHTSIHSYIVNGEQHWANASDPQIPSAIAPVVAGFASLNNFKPRTNYILGPRGVYDPQKLAFVPTPTNPAFTSPAFTNVDQYGNYYLYLGPADAATIYDTPNNLNANLSGPAYDGTGATIGVAGDSNINLTENANYRATFGLAPNPTTVVVDGNDPGENGDAIEAYLDTQVSGGIAPSSSVILYTAADTSLQQGLFLAVQRAIDDNQADILNVSFGECESQLGASGNQYVQSLWEQAAAQGISVVVSAGDSGSAGCDDFDTANLAYLGLALNGLASTPWNIAVGGSDFDILYSNFPSSFTNYVNTTNTLANRRSALGYIPEEPWNDSTYPNTDIAANASLNHNTSSSSGDNIIAGGGGISSLYAVPVWQSAFASGSNRNLPDVALLAGNGFYGALWSICTDQTETGYADCAVGNTGVQLYLTGVGGTSASAPAFAGMLALAKQKTGARLGQADYVLYDLAKSSYSTVFHDITHGDNSVNCEITNGGCSKDAAGYYFMTGYNAATGYDMASGLGSVDASQMVSRWASSGLAVSTSTLQLNGAIAPVSITHGQGVAVTSSVTGAAGAPSGNIALVDSLSPATQPNSEGIADFPVVDGSASGSTNSLPGGSYQVSAHYGGSSVYAQSDSNAISVTVAPESSTTVITNVSASDPATGKISATFYYGFNYAIDAEPYGNSASAAKPNGPATGSITFMNGSTSLGAIPLDAQGIAELTTSLLPRGANSLTASFPGDASFRASTSAPYPLTIVSAVTTLQSSLNYPTSTAVISVGLSTDSLGVAPTGTVTFMNGSTAVGSAPLVGVASTGTTPAAGSVTFSTSTLPAGSYNIVAVYGGDANYAGSSSSALAVTTNRVSTQIVITPSASVILANQPLQVTVTPTPATGLPPPTGSVTLSGSVPTQTANLVSGTANFTYPANSLPLGNNVVIIANYSGDAEYFPNNAIATITVNSSGTLKPTVAVTAPTTVVAQPFFVTVAVSGPSGDPIPTGSAAVVVGNSGNSYSYFEQLTNGSVTFVHPRPANGSRSEFHLRDSYLGDSNYTSGSGSTTVDLFEFPAFTFSAISPDSGASQPLNLAVTLSANGGYPTPTGTLTLSLGSTYTSSPVLLVAGSASFTIPANTLGTAGGLLLASYSGDSNYYASTANDDIIFKPASFTIAATSVTVAPGATTGNIATVTVTPSGGFTGNVALTAALTSSPTGAQDLPTFTFAATAPVSITGAANGTATLIISTTAQTTSTLVYPYRPGVLRYAAGGSVLACVLLFCIPAQRRSWRRVLGILFLLAGFTGLFSCGGGGGSGGGGGGGGGGNPGTTAGNYTITVTATSGTVTQTGTVTLTVQ
jgi:trimeric autotransporter adhesin